MAKPSSITNRLYQDVHIRKAVRKWGNAYGVMISRAEAAELGVGAGDLVDLDLHAFRPASVDGLPSMKAGAIDLDASIAEDLHGSD